MLRDSLLHTGCQRRNRGLNAPNSACGGNAICCYFLGVCRWTDWWSQAACAKCLPDSPEWRRRRCKEMKKSLIFNWRLLKIYYDHSNIWCSATTATNLQTRFSFKSLSVSANVEMPRLLWFLLCVCRILSVGRWQNYCKSREIWLPQKFHSNLKW